MTAARELFSPFLPTTYNIPEEDDRIKVFLTDNMANFADVINDKRIGTFVQEIETQNGEKWWYKSTQVIRNGYQTIIYIPSYPAAGSVTYTVPLSVNTEFVITQVWGSASKPCTAIGAGDGDYFSFYSEGNSKITFTMSDTDILITVTMDMSSYSGFIVIQYLKNGV